MTALRTTTIASPIGQLRAVGDSHALHGLYYPDHRPPPRVSGAIEDPAPFRAAAEQLDAWFSGERTSFEVNIDLDGTPFQRRVWAALIDVPYGTTVTYAQIAIAAGHGGAARAVGHAVARNPVSIIVACHRVVGSSGTLTGYAGGVDRKRRLLNHERDVLARR